MTNEELQSIFEETDKEFENSLTIEKAIKKMTCIKEKDKINELYSLIAASVIVSHKLNQKFLYRLLQKIIVKEP